MKFLTYLRQLHMRAGIVNWETHIYHMFCRRILKALERSQVRGCTGRTADRRRLESTT